MKISYSAPAKVILSGEHAVVYGKPALVSAINLRLKFSLWEEKKRINEKDVLFISQKVKDYLKKEKIDFVDKPFNFRIESNIPIGRGLGASSALSVAASAAFLNFYNGKRFKKEIINNLAYQIEKYFHQNPSGVDNFAACYGGLILYRKEFNSSNFNFEIPKKIADKLFLIDSGKPKETTGEMVDSVGKFYNRSPNMIRKIINDIEKVTIKLESSVKNFDVNLFKECLSNNGKMLEKLKVVSEKTKKLLTDLSDFGGGKITGAGGKKTDSGFILFLAEDKEKLVEFLKRKKIDYYQFVQDHQGLRYEKNQS